MTISMTSVQRNIPYAIDNHSTQMKRSRSNRNALNIFSHCGLFIFLFVSLVLCIDNGEDRNHVWMHSKHFQSHTIKNKKWKTRDIMNNHFLLVHFSHSLNILSSAMERIVCISFSVFLVFLSFFVVLVFLFRLCSQLLQACDNEIVD